jgi:opacity protein-like surface antigen
LAAALAAGGLLAQPSVVHAQGYGYYRGASYGAAQWHIEGGFSDPSGTTSDYLQGGWLVDGGFSYFPGAGALGVRADISYSAYEANGDYLGAGLEPGSAGFGHGYGAISSGAIGAVVRVPVSNRVHFYALAQVGVAYVQLHSDRYYYGGDGCDSYYGCDGYGYGDLYDTTRLGWNVGLGVEFPLYWGQSWFVEAQYRQVQAPTPIQYWPLLVGYRF